MGPIKNSITITQLVLLFAFFFLCLSAREITCPVCHAEECKGGEIPCFYYVVQFYQFIEAHRLQERWHVEREREIPRESARVPSATCGQCFPFASFCPAQQKCALLILQITTRQLQVHILPSRITKFYFIKLQHVYKNGLCSVYTPGRIIYNNKHYNIKYKN